MASDIKISFNSNEITYNVITIKGNNSTKSLTSSYCCTQHIAQSLFKLLTFGSKSLLSISCINALLRFDVLKNVYNFSNISKQLHVDLMFPTVETAELEE